MIQEGRGQGATASTNTDTEIHAFKDRGKKKQTVCKCCGRNHPRVKEACPARDSKCHYCGQIGHWETVCLKKKKS